MDQALPRLPGEILSRDRVLAQDGLMLLSQVGSRLHGISIEGTDDDDEMGICLEPPSYVIGLKRFEQYQWRTQPEGVRSGPGDLDLVVYSLRKWMRLALAGNPTVLLLLFSPAPIYSTLNGSVLRSHADKFRSLDAGKRFLGYMQGQRAKMLGERSTHTNRPELIEQYGYDTKFAGHMVRLGIQGREFLSTGNITLPMLPADARLILDIRNGCMDKQACLDLAASLEADVARLMVTKDLPEHADHDWANGWLVRTYRSYWTWRGM